MSCDYYADENGDFEIAFRTGNSETEVVTKIHTVPHGKIYEDLMKGNAR